MNVVITGASSGIGEATAREFARKGACAGLIARRKDLLDKIAADIMRPAAVAAADVGDRGALIGAIDSLVRALGPIDVLVNNAGMPGGAPFAELDVEDIEQVIDVNLMAPIWATHHVLPSMVARGSGTIVNVASIAGRIGVPRAGAYSGSKFGLAGFTDSLALETSGRGIAMILVNPGPIRTASWPHCNLSGRLVLEPEDVARRIVAATRRGTPEVVIPSYYRIAMWLKVLAPPAYRSMLRRFAERTPPVNG